MFCEAMAVHGVMHENDCSAAGETACAPGRPARLTAPRSTRVDSARPQFAGAAGAPYLGYKRAAFVDPQGTPVAFSLDLAEKDLRLITALAASLGLSLPQAETNLALIHSAAAGGRGGADFAPVAEELRARARRPVAPGAPHHSEEGAG